MRARSPGRWESARDVLAECRRAQEQFAALKQEGLAEVEATLSAKEVRHLTHTVFRINGLIYLYDLLHGKRHDTRLGVLLGSITYLLDHVYDHRIVTQADAEPFERLVMLTGTPRNDPLEHSLRRCAEEMWERVPDPESLRRRLGLMIETQRETMAQANAHRMPRDELERLTHEKGHRSLCLYFTAVNPEFDPREAAALRKFGLYMQYMDDLEDFYEDRAEARQSPVANPLHGALRATSLLYKALPDMRDHYEPRCEGRFGVVTTWISLYHASILSACATREVTRRLPTRLRLWADGFTERREKQSPLFSAAPVALSYLRASSSDQPAADSSQASLSSDFVSRP